MLHLNSPLHHVGHKITFQKMFFWFLTVNAAGVHQVQLTILVQFLCVIRTEFKGLKAKSKEIIHQGNYHAGWEVKLGFRLQ